VAAAGVAIERRTTSFSARIEDLAVVRETAGDCSIQPNVDRVYVLPPGLHKGTGLDGALGSVGLRAARVVAIGDGENDLPLSARSDVALPVANAVPAVTASADEVLASAGPAGVVEAVRRLLAGAWRTDPSPPAAA